jgi:HK97 family phage prohead protease
MHKMEHRFLTTPLTIEQRANKPDSIAGYAAVYYNGQAGSEYQLSRHVVERIKPGAFDRMLDQGDDVVALFNHDKSMVLGRRSAGTLTLEVDDTGLRFSVVPPENQVGQMVLENVRRGDVQGSSFTFMPRQQRTLSRKHSANVRELIDVDVLDVGPVTFPAYQATTADVRDRRPTDEITRRSRIVRLMQIKRNDS